MKYIVQMVDGDGFLNILYTQNTYNQWVSNDIIKKNIGQLWRLVDNQLILTTGK